MKVRIGALAVGLLAVLATLALAMPAQASDKLFHGKDWMKVNYSVVKVCDKESDGNRVWAKGQLRDGTTWSVADKNGAREGCGKKDFILPVYTYKICEKTKGCRHP